MRLLVIAILIMLLITGCGIGQQPTSSTLKQVEITKTDVIPLLQAQNITSKQITVRGVGLGDSKQDVTAVFGTPENFTVFDNVVNYEYESNNDTSVIFHIENNTVQRITLQDGFNHNLRGKTVINATKSGIYRDSGLPESREVVYRYIIFEYPKVGMEILTFRGDEFALSLLPPEDVNKSLKHDGMPKRIPLDSSTIKLQ